MQEAASLRRAVRIQPRFSNFEDAERVGDSFIKFAGIELVLD